MKINVSGLSYPEGKLAIEPFSASATVRYHYTNTEPMKLVIENAQKTLVLSIGNESGEVLIDGDDPSETHTAVLTLADGIKIPFSCDILRDF